MQVSPTPTVDLLSTVLHYLQAASIPGIVWAVWEASRWLTHMEDQVERLISNHLEHAQLSLDRLIDAAQATTHELRELRSDIREIRR